MSFISASRIDKLLISMSGSIAPTYFELLPKEVTEVKNLIFGVVVSVTSFTKFTTIPVWQLKSILAP